MPIQKGVWYMKNDLISRQAAIDAVIKRDANCGIDSAEVLKALPSAQPERKWIPVSERLPEDGTDIFVTYVDEEETRIIPVNYGRGTWFDCIFDRALDSLKVTAWMPLPEPWKGDNNG